MKKILLILIFGLLWCNVGNTGHDGKKTLLSYGKDIVKEALN